MVIIEIELKKLKNASISKHKILSSSEISPTMMIQILNIFQSISDDIVNISEGTYNGNSNNDYIAIQYEHETFFSSLSGSHIDFSFTYQHDIGSFIHCIKVLHD